MAGRRVHRPRDRIGSGCERCRQRAMDKRVRRDHVLRPLRVGLVGAWELVAVTNGLKDSEWEVTYNGVPSPFNCIIFSRKVHAKNQRMHTLAGRNKISDDRRRSDFVGRALVAHNFAQFPSVEGNSGAVPWRNMRISLALARGVRTTTLEAHPTLAAFIQELWPGAG